MNENATVKSAAESGSKPHTTRDTVNRRFSVAPMMDWTTSDCRVFHRLMSRHTLLYTEMVTTGALIHGDAARHLDYDASEHPVALQLGGSNPKELATCARMAQEWGYDEVNLNVGCPSDRVQNNMIGACLMEFPERVAECLAEMQAAVHIPVTVKHRLGIDDLDSFEHLHRFVETVKQSGCTSFTIHARKAILDGLSPKENRDIPPLMYDRVYRIKQLFPELEVVINGGIKTLEECDTHLQQVDGVMIGREAYQNPWPLLSQVDSRYFGDDHAIPSRLETAEAFIPHLERRLAQGAPLYAVVKHLLGLFHGQRGGKQFRRYLSENGHKRDAAVDTFRAALALVQG
ncbi:tRNA dihydrouridine(20/20a) synthase DusA [Marinobacterium sp. AK62]|uniref:tRNA-dihydrouridine(20/20a) synthase n=2 Tax=Marinobacterium alkalitolerans TaxID=1542925 RepID=A0ABS3ZCP2_9GAMM|nr:tRNA dihydrouridine(20/20a) synthase DusA [Marinobacterium alkalitolerans]MBP0049478.1 tRNA dihydrouridine(20/20a) synthase DusA [Marinobacterium alkalitolerans]